MLYGGREEAGMGVAQDAAVEYAAWNAPRAATVVKSLPCRGWMSVPMFILMFPTQFFAVAHPGSEEDKSRCDNDAVETFLKNARLPCIN